MIVRRITWILVCFAGIALISMCMLQSRAEAASLLYSRYHIVEKGDSLWEISKQYGVSINAIKAKNNLRGDTIYPKQKLIIPVTIQGIYHPVSEGETLWRICNTYAVSVEEIVLLNRLADPNCIVPGQKIFIPGASVVKKVVIPQQQEVKVPEQKPPTPVLKSTPKPGDSGIKQRAGMFAVWPVEEKAAYRESGFGIDIAAGDELTVRAVASGEVVAEAPIHRFGGKTLSVIAVEHKGLNLYTVYMYNGVSLVSTGDLVKESQPIAMLEVTTNDDEIILHFEVRQLLDAEPVNPLDYLP